MQPRRLILVGFFLVLLGFVAPFLMVIGIFESTFALNFVSYAASVAGLFIGTYAATMYSKSKRR